MIAGPALFLILSAVAGLHIAWARGRYWPADDERSLVNMVVGRADMARMPPRTLTYVVAGVLIIGGLCALTLGFEPEGPVGNVLAYLGAGYCGIFLLRGLLGYLPPWRSRHPVEPFPTLDKMFYSPACILIGEAFFTLVSARF